MLAWMGYSMLVGALCAAAAALAEPFLRSTGRPTRWLWLAAVATALALSAWAAVSPAATSDDARAARTELPVQGIDVAATPDPAVTTISSTTDVVPTAPPPGESGMDVLLLVSWALASLACIAVLGVSAWRIDRMRRSWREDEFAGVPSCTRSCHPQRSRPPTQHAAPPHPLLANPRRGAVR